jgi:hypothetical protein
MPRVKKGAPKKNSEPFALERICSIFSLSSFERMLLLLCAGMELDSSFASLCAVAQGDDRRAYPTFSLALAALPGAHWSALIPSSALRYWRLIEVGSGGGLTTSPLRIDEKILHYLAGVSHPDERLACIMDAMEPPCDLVPSHERQAELIARAWSQAFGIALLPAVQLCGYETSDMRDIASGACAKLGLRLSIMSAGSLPADVNSLDSLMRLWEREAALGASALFVECHDMNMEDQSAWHILKFMEGTRSALFISSRERLKRLHRSVMTLDIQKPSRDEQYALWTELTGRPAGKPLIHAATLVAQFDLGTRAIHEICDATLSSEPSIEELDARLWEACRHKTYPRLADLAQRITPVAGWDDLVIPEPQRQVLRDIALHVRQRATVYDTWGFAAASARGLGISALFEGTSGTGKTMAAEVLANELRLDLFRIDLSQVVSKYIGETEKNLRQVFDAAESGGAILLFDEADALFGKRSEIKDSHDRYANIEVSYLLQRMENYRGLAILTTNMKSALDQAFLRRIRFIVQFPFPDAANRAAIWERIFPAKTPIGRLDVEKLARLNITGGSIRNIALNAAFLAAGDGGQVQMNHLLAAARSEYTKLEKPLSAAEINGWP